VLNLKTAEGTKMLRSIAHSSAELVKKYNGSLSGEHGDGRLRAEVYSADDWREEL
jgi:FAD/FMN-containing dehydrogenase